MAQSQVIYALVEKRGEVSGRIAELEEFIRQARADLAHIDATLLMFDPEITPAAIRAKAPAKGRSGYFANGEISKRCREAIRLAGGDPVAAESIVRQAMIDKGLDPDDAKLRRDMIRRFLWALHRMQVTGSVERIGRGLGARWGAPRPRIPHLETETDLKALCVES